jgi:transcriptional regulator with XRE-family HTH domain
MLAHVGEPIYREFGRLVREAREKADGGRRMTQEALAKRVRLSRTSITNIERGNQHVGLHLLYDLARALGKRPAELLPDEATIQQHEPSLEELLEPLGRGERAKVIEQIDGLQPETKKQLMAVLRRERN